MSRFCASLLALLLLSTLEPLHSVVLPRRIGSLWTWAQRQAKYEQVIEDANTPYRVQSYLVRDLLVMPLPDNFVQSKQNPLYQKVQFSDKCSLPASLGRDLFRKPYEVPWIFSVRKAKAPSPEKPLCPVNLTESAYNTEYLDRVYVSPLDFRAPENYIFLPGWVMKALGVHPLDRVHVRFVRLQLSTKVVLQPLNKTWSTVFMSNNRLSNGEPRDPTRDLEQQLNKFSALTSGSVIQLQLEGGNYSFLVNETRGESGVSVYGVRVQDADVNVEIDSSIVESKP